MKKVHRQIVWTFVFTGTLTEMSLFRKGRLDVTEQIGGDVLSQMLGRSEKNALSATSRRFSRAMHRARPSEQITVLKPTPQHKIIKALQKRKITEIWVENCELNDMFLHAVAQFCPHLETLCLEYSTCSFTDDGMMAIGANAEEMQWQQGCPRLQKFTYNALSSYKSGDLTLLGIKAVFEGCPEIKTFENTDKNVRYAPMLPIRSLFARTENDIQRKMDRFARWQRSVRHFQDSEPIGEGNWMIHPRWMTGGVHTREQAENVRAWLRMQYPDVGAGFLTNAQRSDFKMNF